jgi:predicted enzyme related to lactoylglutathione lyase
MIRGLHGLFYSSDSAATRAFMRDALKLPFTDVGGGWLIFDLPEGDVGVHPIDEGGQPPPNTHDVSFYCDDIQGTVAELRARGVEFKQEPADHGYGFVTYFTMPGGIEVQLYEPKYQKAVKRSAKAPIKAAKKSAKAPVKAGNKAGKKAAAARVVRAPAKKPAAKGKAAAKKSARR